MDKLQPLLVHRFWICGGTAVIMSILGWWLSTSKLAAETEKRITEVKAAKGKAVVGPDAPNRVWVDQLMSVNTRQDKLVDASREEMWEQQKGLMKWPSGVERYMSGKEYREKSESAVQTVFQQFYDAERERIRHILRPFSLEDDEGVVHFEIDTLPAPEKYLNKQQWFAPLSWEELWDTAEDTWLIEDLVTSINDVNRDYESIGDAPVRGIYRFELHGGQPRKLAEEEADGESAEGGGEGDGAGAMGEGAGGEGGMAPGMAPPGLGSGSGMGVGGFGRPGAGGGGGTTQGFASKPSIDINPVEVFGVPTQSSTGGGGAEGAGEGMPGGSGSGMVAPGMMPPGMGGGEGGAGAGASGPRRYVDDGEELPFKTRGFVLGLVVHHDFVPKVIAELTASNWPVEILRVHQQDFFEDPLGRGVESTTGANVAAGGGGGGGPTGTAFPSSAGAAPASPGEGGGGLMGGGNEPMETSPILALFGGQQGGAGGGRPTSMVPGGGRFGSPGKSGGFGAGLRPGVRPGARPGAPEGGGTTEAKQPPGYQTLNAALNDRGLVRLEIAGLLTLYSPPQVKPEGEEGADTPTSPDAAPGNNPTESSPSEVPGNTAATETNPTPGTSAGVPANGTSNGTPTSPPSTGSPTPGSTEPSPSPVSPPAGTVKPPENTNPPATTVNPSPNGSDVPGDSSEAPANTSTNTTTPPAKSR